MGSPHIRRRRKNGQFAPALSLPAKAPHSAPTHPQSYSRLPEHLRLLSGVVELSPDRPHTPQDVVNVLHVAKARLYAAMTNPELSWVADLEDARLHWRAQAIIAERHGDTAAADCFYEVSHLSEKVSNYLQQAPDFECRHPGETDCDNCERIEVESAVDRIVDFYRNYPR